MNWKRGGRISAVYGLFGTLALGGCAGGGDRADLASNADTSMAPAAREASVPGPGTVDKLICVPALGRPLERQKSIDSRGDTILIAVQRPNQTAVQVALLTVPKDAVSRATKFTLSVPGKNLAYALVRAEQNNVPFTGPFKPNNLELAIYYKRGCRLSGAGTPADQVLDLNGFQVWPQQELDPDPDPMVFVPGTNDHSTSSVTLKLEHLSGYILAQGIVKSPLDTIPIRPTTPQPSDSTASSAL